MPTQGEIIQDLAERLTAQLIIARMEDCKTIEEFEKLKEDLKAKYNK